MPPKPGTQPDTQTQTKPHKKIGSLICGFRSPGPKYPLKTLVGYQEHCLSKYRNPAYTFGNKYPSLRICEGPGPKYLLDKPIRGGFSFGLVGKIFDTSCTPGPKYLLPSPKGPSFTLKSRTKQRKCSFSPGPYNVKFPISGPAFFIGERLAALRRDPTPGPKFYNDALVAQRAPMYSVTFRRDEKIICRSPGPKYNPKPPKPQPMFSFGIKHSECSPPYIVKCDDQC
ncbi:outer dense fiber protein 3-like [Bombus pyrosoma]|uniref:outer dense fiber protein 3-like n=1 Tax=Bombus pyrosoma TaxID=396416 RepID=UPI001CB8F9CE|nr:outer dense fiber protein 3-like [Bombus pyrosoma]